MLVTTVVAGGIAILRPFTAASRPFLRDIVFYMAAVFLIFYALYLGRVTLAWALGERPRGRAGVIPGLVGGGARGTGGGRQQGTGLRGFHVVETLLKPASVKKGTYGLDHRTGPGPAGGTFRMLIVSDVTTRQSWVPAAAMSGHQQRNWQSAPSGPGRHWVTGCALVRRVPGLVCVLRGHCGSLHLDLPVAAEEVAGLLHASYPR